MEAVFKMEEKKRMAVLNGNILYVCQCEIEA